MKCEQCGATNRRKAKFCAICGERIGEPRVRDGGTTNAGATEVGSGRRVPLVALGGILLVIGVAAAFFLLGDSATPVHAENGLVRIPLAQVSDGNAHYFSYDANGTPVKFFVLKAGDGLVRAALDTCDVCYKEQKGYRQEGNVMVCNNCDQPFPAKEINLRRGGCNPVPLERRIEGADLVLNEKELIRCSGYFQAG